MSSKAHAQMAKPEASIQPGSRGKVLQRQRTALLEPDDANETAPSGYDAFHSSTPSAPHNPNLGHNFSRVSVFPLARKPIQPKLRISDPNDIYEQEADRVAEQVMRMPESAVGSQQPGVLSRANGTVQTKPLAEQITPLIQREAAQPEKEEGEEKVVQTKPLAIMPLIQREVEETKEERERKEEEETKLQMKQLASQNPELPPSLDLQINNLHGSGQPLPDSVRSFFEPRFGYDFSKVRVHNDSPAAESAQAVDAQAYTVGHDIVFGANEYAPKTNKGKLLLAHELWHVIQQSSPTRVPLSVIMRQKGKLLQKVVGWVVKVGERKLIKTVAIYSEKELVTLLGKGYNVLVKRSRSVAKRIAKKVWGDNVIHHTGHIIKKTGKQGLSHFQPGKHLIDKAGEKGWHIFYSAIPIIFFSEDVEAIEVYEDKYPGKSIANYLTVTKYVGEDSWLSYLDWINPFELIAIGGDIGRDLDRERTKEIKALVFNRVASDGTAQTYELTPDGELVRVILVRPDGKQKILSADEYYTFLGKTSEKTLPEPVEQDGTKHPLYASTFDADYRIYISKQGWASDMTTRSFYLPAESAKKLQKIGEFYVMEDLSIGYVYAYVRPRHRGALREPGFKVPEDMVDDYISSSKDTYLQKMLTSALQSTKVRKADLWLAK